MISTIIPVYNGAAYLSDALDSVLGQDYEPAEVIVVDDGSTDSSAEIAGVRPGVRTISIQHQGVAAARNVGLGSAAGEFIAFLDADDVWETGKLAKQATFLAENPEVDGVFGWMRNFLDGESDRPDWLRTKQLDQDTPGYSLCTLRARRGVFDRVGKFNPALPSGEDGDWFFRAKDLGIRFEMMLQRFLLRRIRDRNLSHDAKAVRSGILDAVRESLKRKFTTTTSAPASGILALTT